MPKKQGNLVKKHAEPANPQQQNTILDWYQNLMRAIWRKIGINPDWVHGLDELTTMFTIASYAVALFFRIFSNVGQGSVQAPMWGNLTSMLCSSIQSVPTNSQFKENGYMRHDSSDVVFASNGNFTEYDILIYSPIKVEPFVQEGYQSLIGAVNAIVCQNPDPILQLDQFQSPVRVLFGFGHTAEQIKKAAEHFKLNSKLSVQILSQRGFSKLVGGDNTYLGKLLCPSCMRSAFADVFENGIEIAKNALKLKKDKIQRTHSAVEVTYHMYTGQKGADLDLGYEKDEATEFLKEVVDQGAFQLLQQLKEIIKQTEKLLKNDKVMEVIKQQPEMLGIFENKVIQSITVFGIQVTFGRGIFYVMAFLLTLPLAINMNVYHKKERLSFLKSITIGFNIRLITFALSAAASMGIYYVFSIINKENKDNIYKFDFDGVFKMVGCTIVLISWVCMKYEPTQLYIQRNQACLLLIFYLSIIIKSQMALFFAQVCLFGSVGMWVVEIAILKGYIQRTWAVNAVYSLSYFLLSTGMVLPELFFGLFNNMNNKSVYLYIVLTAFVLSFLTSYTGQYFKSTKGKIVVSIGVGLAAFFYCKLSFANALETRIIDNLLQKLKVSKLPCNEGLNKVRIFCMQDRCKVHLESGHVQNYSMKDQKIDLFQGNLVLKLGDLIENQVKKFDQITLGGESGVEYQQVAFETETKMWWRGDAEVWQARSPLPDPMK